MPKTKTTATRKTARAGIATRPTSAEKRRKAAPADGAQDHEVPTAKEIANTPKPRTPTRARASGLDLAARVLAASKEPLNAKAIAERVISAGWSTGGKTPHATLHAAISREISSKGKDSRFRKAGRGTFASAGKAA